MPIELADLELKTAARARRALEYQEEQAATKMENPGMRGAIESRAKRAAKLAEKVEAGRKRQPQRWVLDRLTITRCL